MGLAGLSQAGGRGILSLYISPWKTSFPSLTYSRPISQ